MNSPVGPARVLKQSVLSFDETFQGETLPGIDRLISSLPKSEAVQFISYLLFQLGVRHKDDHNFHKRHFNQWVLACTGEDQRTLGSWMRDHVSFLQEANWILFTKRSLLQVLRILLRSASPMSRQFNPEDWSNLLRAVLACNKRENIKSERLFNWVESADIEERLNQMLPVQCSNLELDRKKDVEIPFLKAIYLFGFFTGNHNYLEYRDSFLRYRGLKTTSEYVGHIYNVFLNIVVAQNPSNKITIAHEFKDVIQLFDQFAINNRTILDGEDYTDLQSYPLFKVDENTYSVLFVNFLIDKLFQGFLFDFVTILKENGYPNMSFPKLKTQLGYEFSEQAVFYPVMKVCCTQGTDSAFSGVQLAKIIGDGFADYYVRQNDRIVLLEMKDLTLSSKVKHSGNAETIKSEILKKLEWSRSGRPKGLTQIVNSIEKLTQNNLYQQLDPAPLKDRFIYPLIVHTELALEAEGVNYFLDTRFRTELASRSLTTLNICNLILINLDTLILLQDHFSDGRIIFSQLLMGYEDYVMNGADQNKMVCFDEWVKRYVMQTFGKYASPIQTMTKALYDVRGGLYNR
jgi:hypothetical protein